MRFHTLNSQINMNREEIITFGQWVKERRKAAGMSQSQLAARLDIAPGSISAIESGVVRSVGPNMVAKLRAYFEGGTPQPATQTLQSLNLTGLETLTPALRKLAAVSLAGDFHERVQKAQEALGCTEAEAAAQIFLWELQKIK